MKNKKHMIRVALIAFFGTTRPGDTFKSEVLVDYCKRHLRIKHIFADTILRYARQLREQGMLNYTCIHKATRMLKVLGPDECHSL